MAQNPFEQAFYDLLNRLGAGMSGLANVPPGYPDRAEIDLARRSQFGNPLDAEYTQGKRARIAPGQIVPLLTDPQRLRGTLIGEPSPRVADAMTATALLANRAPVAGLGWDPRQATFNDSPFRASHLAGEYHYASDRMYVDEQTSKGTGLHEAVHRGVEQLRQAGSATARRVTPQQEEAIGRFVEQHLLGMKPRPGTPEYTQGPGYWTRNPEIIQLLNSLNTEAAELVAKRRPGGPR